VLDIQARAETERHGHTTPTNSQTLWAAEIMESLRLETTFKITKSNRQTQCSVHAWTGHLPEAHEEKPVNCLLQLMLADCKASV